MEKVKIEMHRDDIEYIYLFFARGNSTNSSNSWSLAMLLQQTTAFTERLEVLKVKFKQKKVITKVLAFTATECWLLDMFCRSSHPNALNDVYFQTLLRKLAAELDKQIKQVVV